MAKADYDFNLVTPVDYSCILSYETDNRLIKTIFSKSMIKLRRKHKDIHLREGIEAKENVDLVKEFDVDPRFFNLLRTIISGNFKKVVSDVKEDNIEVMSSNISNAKFIKEGEKWQIKITITGACVDKR